MHQSGHPIWSHPSPHQSGHPICGHPFTPIWSPNLVTCQFGRTQFGQPVTQYGQPLTQFGHTLFHTDLVQPQYRQSWLHRKPIWSYTTIPIWSHYDLNGTQKYKYKATMGNSIYQLVSILVHPGIPVATLGHLSWHWPIPPPLRQIHYQIASKK